jgi:catechol 2,3-dioxygenase-like lactoylglutathione lyase family enzyme
MTLALNHFSIRTTDMEATRVFYEAALGRTAATFSFSRFVVVQRLA